MTRRILHIVSDLQPSGTTTQLKLLAAGLARDKFEIHVAALNGGSGAVDLQSSGIEVTVIGRRWTVDPVAFRRLRKYISLLQPAVVHTWEFHANTYGRMAALSAKVPHVVASERKIDRWKTDIHKMIDNFLARRTQRIITNSIVIKNDCLARGLPAEKLTYIHNAAAVPPPSAISRSKLLTELSLPKDAVFIGYGGQLTKHTRLKELIWAVDQLKAVGTSAHLLIVGQGPLRNQLERYTWLNRVEERVHFLGLRNDVAQLLTHINVLWHAGDREGQSSVILEAMAAGIPVVAADAAGNRELIVPSETGFLVPLNERAGFARATLPILEDSALARRMGAAGQRRVEEFFRLDNMLTAYTKLYEEL